MSNLSSINQEEQFHMMTETPIEPLIIRLAIPTVISMMVTNIYNTADTFFVSQLGTSASGATGIVFALMALFQAIGFMCGHGAGSFVSRFLGAKKEERAKIYGASAFFLCIFLSTLLAVVCFIFMKPLLLFMGSTKTILPYAISYAIFIFLSGPFLSASCTMNNILRYEGKAFYAMIGLMTGGVINMIMDPIFMFGFGMGVWGAGLSTLISQIISFFILLYMIMSGKTVTRFSPKLISKERRVYTQILKVGFPSMCRQGLNAISTLLLNREAAVYGDAAIAAMSIVGRVNFFIASIALGVGQGMQPVTSFNFGAGKYSRVRRAYRFMLAAGTSIMIVFAIVIFGFSEDIIRWFRDDREVIVIGTLALQFSVISDIFQPGSISSNMLFQSIGKAGRATFLATLRTGICFIPLILVLPEFFGITGIELAQPLADVLASFIALPFSIYFLRHLPDDI
ncbi:MAG: MATE family efflux transporter [Lachnospiraceae bacterium]|nr:MATE family efflux transporter [Lachnospiraceae bacterium]